MRLACVHCFTIEAADRADGARILGDLRAKIDAASARLDIGYRPGFMTGQPQPDEPPIPTDPERLFDE